MKPPPNKHFLFVPPLDSHYLSHNLVMKHIPGADPELVLLNHYYVELDVSLPKSNKLLDLKLLPFIIIACYFKPISVNLSNVNLL